MANYNECFAAGLNFDEVERLQRRLERAGRDAAKMGLQIFGGSGSGSLRFDQEGKTPLVVANILGGHWDGGDGGTMKDEDGLERGDA